MTIPFYKYQGTGNDFVVIDNRELGFDKNELSSIKKLCDRKFGIGADGVLLIEEHPDLDFELIYYNADGSQSFCGNGSRCGVAFAHFLGMIGAETTFHAIDGVHQAKITQNGVVELKMNDVKGIEQLDEAYFLNTGSPHYILYKKEVENINIIQEAHAIRYNDRFKKEGTNVNFVQVEGEKITMRTYERGVEDETLSCGTGATAVALTTHLKHQIPSPISIQVPGGNLTISFKKITPQEFTEIWLIGEAKQVFSGTIIL